jgi:acyl-coenzyme A synthetase/AMP-(fatty) acid ligase
MLMLAVVRIGAIHSVVFAGFGAGALGERIRLSGSKAVFAADVTWRKGNTINLKEIVDKALTESGESVERVVVLPRAPGGCAMTEGRDITWEEFVAGGDGHDGSHMLPKTRSGKIMRRVFKAVVMGKDVGDVSTIEDEGSVEEAGEAWKIMMKEVGG